MDELPDYITVLREYFRKGSTAVYSRGHKLSFEDGTKHLTYYLSSGYVRVHSANSRGDQYTHIIYGPGDIFPLMLLTKQQRVFATYEAMTQIEIYCQEHESMVEDLIKQDGLAFGMMQQVIEQHRIYSLRVDNLEYKYASERLAYRLILLANRFGEHSGSTVTIVPPMTHQVLGSSLNLSRESVSREMEKLIRKGLVRYNSGRQIILTDVPALAEYARVPHHQGLSE